MAFENLTSRIKNTVNNFKEDQAQKKINEEARKQKIISGQIEPIQVIVNLEPSENAFAEFVAKRMAIVDNVIENTVSRSKKKGVITRAVVGGVLLGPLGAVGGAATAGNKGTSRTSQQTISKLEIIDNGSLVLTNKRIIFLGRSTLTLPYEKLLSVSFGKTLLGNKLVVKYDGMLKDEHFILNGEKAKDIELYYHGINKHLLLDKISVNR
ncbi:MAG: PH domain-containing protein [bacterium]